jgi:hypothetical protein
MYKQITRYLALSLVLIILLGGCRICSPYYTLGGKYDTNYDGKDLEINFKNKEKELLELMNYCKTITPRYKVIRFGFDERSDRLYLSISTYDTITKQPIYPVQGWSGLKIDSNELDTILSELDWNRLKLKTLVDKLKQANCIGVKTPEPFNDKPITINYRYGGHKGLALYSYLLFENQSKVKLIDNYGKKEEFSVYKDNVVFVYGYPL